jgi:sulfate permease, SulP family
VQLWDAIISIPKAKVPTLIMSLACIAALLAMKRWLRRIPGPIVIVALTILVTWLWDLQNYGIALISPVPSGVPLPSLPHFGGSLHLIAPALGVALIAFVESIAAARAFQRSDDRPVSADRELGAVAWRTWFPHFCVACQQGAAYRRPRSMMAPAPRVLWRPSARH